MKGSTRTSHPFIPLPDIRKVRKDRQNPQTTDLRVLYFFPEKGKRTMDSEGHPGVCRCLPAVFFMIGWGQNHERFMRISCLSSLVSGGITVYAGKAEQPYWERNEMKLIKACNGTSLIIRILCGLVIGALPGMVWTGLPGIGLLGELFAGGLKAIAPVLVFALVISSIARGKNMDSRFILEDLFAKIRRMDRE